MSTSYYDQCWKEKRKRDISLCATYHDQCCREHGVESVCTLHYDQYWKTEKSYAVKNSDGGWGWYYRVTKAQLKLVTQALDLRLDLWLSKETWQSRQISSCAISIHEIGRTGVTAIRHMTTDGTPGNGVSAKPPSRGGSVRHEVNHRPVPAECSTKHALIGHILASLDAREGARVCVYTNWPGIGPHSNHSKSVQNQVCSVTFCFRFL